MLIKFTFLSLFFFCLITGKCQNHLADVNLDKIEDGAVERYLNHQMENHISTFTELAPSLTPESSTKGYAFNEREYIVKDSLNKVWSHYVNTNPAEAWNARKFNFALLFSKNQNEIFYPNQQVGQVEIGQIVYLNLNVLIGVKKLCAAFEITCVDKEKGIIEFSYLKDNITHGKQQLHFVETPKGYTKIVHCSYFKSKSRLRDHFLYPYFHNRLTNTYHRNMKKLYEEDSHEKT